MRVVRVCNRSAFIEVKPNMKWTSWILASLAAIALGACSGERRDDGAGTRGGTETGTMRGGATTDTAVPTTGATDTGSATGGMSDTAHGGARIHSDTNHPTSGASGTGTSKGDSVRSGGDTSGADR